ncbi:MAG: sulfur relay protein DsrC [Gammaproteobacteria bacterium]
MLWLSEVLLQAQELQSFDDLVVELKRRAREGELFFRMDVKPPYPDTPPDWEDRLEAAFTSRQE